MRLRLSNWDYKSECYESPISSSFNDGETVNLGLFEVEGDLCYALLLEPTWFEELGLLNELAIEELLYVFIPYDEVNTSFKSFWTPAI